MITFLVLFTAVLFASVMKHERQNEQQRKRMEIIRTEQIRQREELRQRQKEAEEWVFRQIETEREQIRLAKEQARQAEQLAKHDRQIAQLEFRVAQAEADIETTTERIGKLYALLDIAEAQQAAAVPGSPQDVKYQKQILTLENQIAAAEKRLRKAQFTKQEAERQLAA